MATLMLLPAACTDDDDTSAGDGTGGTAGPPEAEPVDPLDGGGSDPPGRPDQSAGWSPPATLGNGLVHDSRYDLAAGAYSTGVTASQLVAGVDWADFVASHTTKLRNGFRPTGINAQVSLTGKGALRIADRSVYVSDDDANYRSQTKTYVFANKVLEQGLVQNGPAVAGDPRPTSIDTFSLAGGEVGDTIVWTYDSSPVPWRITVGQSKVAFEATLNALKKLGFRPISIASRRRNGASEYATIYVQDGVPSSDWLVSIGQTWSTLVDNTKAHWNSGYYPFRRTCEEGAQQGAFNILWTKRTPELSVEIRENLDDALFNEQDIAWRKQGYHLESACGYEEAGAERVAAIWMRSEPYLRVSVGDTLDDSSASFAARYAPFEQRTIQAMTLQGDFREGEFFRPSATLHIFEGGELVLNRAYTYAPANYPDTPLDAPMALASVSKSITAAAVVRELNLKGIPLTAPFAGAAGIKTDGINGVPNMSSTPTIADVLRNLGGFNDETASYSNHSMMKMTYPIDGKKMYEHVVNANAHLDKGGNDSYWDIATYLDSQKNGTFVYSNPGFSMLGELVRVQSGVPYATYVRDNLLAPLNLHQEIYPDPGQRNAVVEPTQAGLRSYLVNDRHPYVMRCSVDANCSYLPGGMCGVNNTCTGCSVNNPCKGKAVCNAGECTSSSLPRLASQVIPGPASGDNSPVWAENVGPVEPSAPDRAAVARYAGRVYMGGAPLAAGGWHADGESLGLLIRTLAQYDFLMPFGTARQLWDPQWWNFNHMVAPGWAYGLGWYVRGNWIAMAGGSDGAMATVLHNRRWDFTVVILTNVLGNGFDEILAPLFVPSGGWGTSLLGQQFPCGDDPATPSGNECGNSAALY